jgi:AAA family ATP:ADP antiporter
MEAELLQDRADRSLEHLFTLLSLVFPRDILRLAFHGLHNGDAYLRGTALEYLETVLPEAIWLKLWPLLARGEPRPVRSRNPEQAMQDLLATQHSISMSLAEARRALGRGESGNGES